MKNNIEYLYTLYKKVIFLNFKRMYPKVKKLGLYPGQPEVLRIIASNNGITQVELAHLTQREAATITRTIQRLEANLYIRRVTDDIDKRKEHLFITDKGRELVNHIEKAINEATEFCFSDLTDEEIKTLIGILERIQNKFNNEGIEEKC